MIINAKNGKGPIVVLTMTLEQAEWARDALADVACWISGFKAGLGPDRQSDAPLGHDAVRELNIALKTAIGEAL